MYIREVSSEFYNLCQGVEHQTFLGARAARVVRDAIVRSGPMDQHEIAMVNLLQVAKAGELQRARKLALRASRLGGPLKPMADAVLLYVREFESNSRGTKKTGLPRAPGSSSQSSRIERIIAFDVALANARGRRSKNLDPLIDFLEDDPHYDGTGYAKEMALLILKQRSSDLDHRQTRRLEGLVLRALQQHPRRVTRYYMRLAAAIPTREFVDQVRRLMADDKQYVRALAEEMLRRFPRTL
jgi:hypothetical protein